MEIYSKKDFKSVELLTKSTFNMSFKVRPKNWEGNKQRRHREYMRKVNKTCTKKKLRKLMFIWNDYEQLIMNCFDCIITSTDDVIYLISVFSMVSWSLYFLQHLLSWSTKSMKPNGKTSVRNGLKFFLLF